MKNTEHVHSDQAGVLHRCFHHCRGLLTNWQFWVGTFGGFLPEHLIWDKVPPFSYLTHWIGL